MIYKPDKVSKMKGADIIAEYMMKEKIPYMIGYAGHGAIGMLDSFFNKQDDIKIVWPRIETACGFMADAYFRVTKQSPPVRDRLFPPVRWPMRFMTHPRFCNLPGRPPCPSLTQEPSRSSTGITKRISPRLSSPMLNKAIRL